MVVEIGNLYNIDRRRDGCRPLSWRCHECYRRSRVASHFLARFPSWIYRIGYDVRMRLRGSGGAHVLHHGAADPDVSVIFRQYGGYLRVYRLGEEDLHYDRIDGVKHRWQPQLNQHWYESWQLDLFLRRCCNEIFGFRIVGFLSLPLQAKEAPSAPEVELDSMVAFEAGGFNMGYHSWRCSHTVMVGL